VKGADLAHYPYASASLLHRMREESQPSMIPAFTHIQESIEFVVRYSGEEHA